MDNLILKCLCEVALHESESDNLLLDDSNIGEGIKEEDLSVFIHVCGNTSFNLEGFKTAMGKSWCCGSFSIQRFNEDFFQGFFGTQEIMDFALNHGRFENYLVLVCSRSCLQEQASTTLEKEFFWVLLT